jgi:hypothetical protein
VRPLNSCSASSTCSCTSCHRRSGFIDQNEDGENGLPFVIFTPEAQAVFDKWYAENEKAKRETDDDDLAELMGKHDKRCAALALIHALVEWLGELVTAKFTLEQIATTPEMPWSDNLPRFRGVGPTARRSRLN